MNTYTYVAIYLLTNALIIAFVPEARGQYREFIKLIPQYYKRFRWDFTTSKLKKAAKKTLMTLLLVMFLCLIFILALPLLPILIKRDRKRVLEEKEHQKEQGFIQKVSGKVILEGFVSSISPITIFDSNNSYIEISLVIYPRNGGSQYYYIICVNELAEEVGKEITTHCKIRVVGKFRTLKGEDDKGNKIREKVVKAEKIDLLRLEDPLTFSSMGGSGTIQCFECKYEQNTTSFIHGAYEAYMGYQCQNCGDIRMIRSVSKEYHKINIVDSLVCDCGGALEREKPLFCPKCKSKRLSYGIRQMS